MALAPQDDDVRVSNDTLKEWMGSRVADKMWKFVTTRLPEGAFADDGTVSKYQVCKSTGFVPPNTNL